MVRLSPRGAISASPCRREQELGGCLADIGVFIDEAGITEIYDALYSIVGEWWAEKGRLESAAVANALASIGGQLDKIGITLNAHATGPRDSLDIEIVSRLTEYIALDRNVGSVAAAKDLIASFVQNASTIARRSVVAGTDLRTPAGKRGRTRLEWYDNFTALLLKIANRGGIEPALNKDRDTGKRNGWLFEAALALETFLYPDMRSPSAEACGKRLERSKRRLVERQKSTRRRPNLSM